MLILISMVDWVNWTILCTNYLRNVRGFVYRKLRLFPLLIALLDISGHAGWQYRKTVKFVYYSVIKVPCYAKENWTTTSEYCLPATCVPPPFVLRSMSFLSSIPLPQIPYFNHWYCYYCSRLWSGHRGCHVLDLQQPPNSGNHRNLHGIDPVVHTDVSSYFEDWIFFFRVWQSVR